MFVILTMNFTILVDCVVQLVFKLMKGHFDKFIFYVVSIVAIRTTDLALTHLVKYYNPQYILAIH